MSWSAILKLITGVIGFLRELMDSMQSARDRQAGQDAAINAGRAQEDDALKRTQDAIDEADRKPIEYRD